MQRLTIVLANYSDQIETTTTMTIAESIDLDHKHSKWWSFNPDIVLAFGLIIFYAIFVLFIVFIVIRIILTICMSTNRKISRNPKPKIHIHSDYGLSESESNSYRTGTLANSLSMMMMMVVMDDSLLRSQNNHQQNDFSSTSFLDPNQQQQQQPKQ